jgi:hypothetical protein
MYNNNFSHLYFKELNLFGRKKKRENICYSILYFFKNYFFFFFKYFNLIKIIINARS